MSADPERPTEADGERAIIELHSYLEKVKRRVRELRDKLMGIGERRRASEDKPNNR